MPASSFPTRPPSLHIHAVYCIFLRMQVGIAGASGYAGAELLRLCAGHPELEVVVAGADTQAGQPVAALYPSLAAAYPTLEFSKVGVDDLAGLDVVFLALPHGESQELAPGLVGRVGLVVDLSADFRLRDAGAYPRVVRARPCRAPSCSASSPTGCPSCSGPSWPGPGWWRRRGATRRRRRWRWRRWCEPGAIETTGVIVDAASGVSGAGRKLSHTTHFNTADEDFTAYGLLHHRHTPEIEQATGAQVLFTPHLAPMNRGILATCYARPTGVELDHRRRPRILRDAYAGEPFVVVSEASPSTKATSGSNCAHVTARVDPRTGVGAGAVRARQPGQGGVGPGGAVRQHRPRPARDTGLSDRGGVSVSVTAPEGFVAAAGWRAGSRRRARPTWPWWPSTRARCPPPGCSPPTWPRPPPCR